MAEVLKAISEAESKPEESALSAETELFLSRESVAKRWECSPRTVKRREQRGELTPIVLSGQLVRYRLSEILAIEADAEAK